MPTLKGKKYRKPLADIAKLCQGRLVGHMPSETSWSLHYDDDYDRDAAISALVTEQASALRQAAEIVEQTGMPVNASIIPMFPSDPSDIDGKREYARLKARYVNAVGQQHCPKAKREKILTESIWGMKVDLGGGINYRISVWNEATCEMVPVNDENGEAIFEEVVLEAREAQTIKTQKTERKCITLFADK